MASYYRAPDPLQSTQLIPGGNTPASAALLFIYVANSSTKQTVYKDGAGSASHTNPIVLDSGGNIPNNGSIWIPTGVTIDAVLAPSNDTDPPASPYWTKEDLSGVNDVSASSSDWVTGPTPTFLSATSFTLVGDQTATFKVGRKIKTTNTGGTIYSRITASVFGALTTVSVVNDSGSLDSGLSAVSYSLIDASLSSISDYYVNRMAASVASAGNGTTNIWGVDGNSLHVTGTNTIVSFSTAAIAGAQREVIFDGVLTLQTSAAFLSCPSGNITTEAGDRAHLVASTVTHTVITQYERARGIPLVAGVASTGIGISGPNIAVTSVGSFAATQAEVEAGAIATVFLSPARAQHHPSAAKFWCYWLSSGTTISASYNVTSVTNTGVGNESITFTNAFSSANYAVSGMANTSNSGDATAGRVLSWGSIATTSIQVMVADLANPSAFQDATVGVIGFGDL